MVTFTRFLSSYVIDECAIFPLISLAEARRRLSFSRLCKISVFRIRTKFQIARRTSICAMKISMVLLNFSMIVDYWTIWLIYLRISFLRFLSVIKYSF